MKKPTGLVGRLASLYCLLTAVLVLGVGCGSSGSSGNEDERATFAQLWIQQKPEEILIAEGEAGEASLTRNFYFIMDGSGSMRERTSNQCGGDQKFNNKIEGADWAIKQFLESVPEDVNIGLYVFDSVGQREVVALGTGNRDEFTNAVDNIQAAGGTPLAEAIRYGTDQLVSRYRKQLGYGEFRLVVVTDGIADDIPQAALYAAKYGIPIYTIGLCVDQNHPLRQFSVSYRAADNFADLSQGLQDTLAELPDFDKAHFEGEETTGQDSTADNLHDSEVKQ